MCIFLGWSQTPAPGEQESLGSIHGRLCQSPTPAAQWFVGKLTKFPSQRVCHDHYPKESVDHMSALEAKLSSTECGVSNSILTDVLSRVLKVTAWSFPLPPDSRAIHVDLTWSDSLPVRVISSGDESGFFCEPWEFKFLELVVGWAICSTIYPLFLLQGS